MKIQHLGWGIAAALAGIMIGSGFRGPTDKVGVVDLVEVFSSSEFAKSQSENLKTISQNRRDLLQFANTYPVFTQEKAQRFRDLSIKPQPTAAEKTELEKLKNDAIADNKKFSDLQTNAKPTPEQVASLREYNERAQAMVKTIERWAREFSEEIQNMQDKLREDTMARVKTAVKEVGAKQGYSVVYVQDFVPYAANNVTGDALKAMNAKK